MRLARFILALLLIYFQAASAQTYWPIGGGGPSSFFPPNYTANAGLPHWQACRAKVNAGTGNCTIVVLGESTSVSFDAAYNGVLNDALSIGTPNQVAGVLSQIYGISTQTNVVAGNHAIDGCTASAATYRSFDTRVTATNGWIVTTGTCPGSAFDFGGYPWLATDTTAFVFHPTDAVSYTSTLAIPTNAIDVWTEFVSSGQSLVVKVGATTICTIAGPISVLTKTTCNAPSLADNTYSMNCSAAFSCSINELVARNTTISQVTIMNGAFGGAVAANLADAAITTAVAAFHPDLCILNDLGNDIGAGTSPSAYQASITSIIQNCQSSGDVLVTTGVIAPNTPFPCSNDGNVTCTNIRNALIAAATATKAAFWDSGLLIPSTQYNSNFGWNGAYNGATPDVAHQGAAGYAVYGTLLAQILMQ
jgi:lysophospholipase L1-like esterase